MQTYKEMQNTSLNTDKNLIKIQKKLEKNLRLDFEDGLILYKTNDINTLGQLANFIKSKKHDNKAFYVYNQHINYTNICINKCLFCAYAKDKNQKDSFVLSIQDIEQILKKNINKPIVEFHIVGGLNPDISFEYYIDVLKTIKKYYKTAIIKAFTAVEIDYFSKIANLSVQAIFEKLKEAGLSMLPGGGAEILSNRVHDKLFPKKINSDRWLEIMEIAHKANIKTNATMLYGHIETIDEKIEHLIKLRCLQDKTDGFSAFIPLAFQPANTKLASIYKNIYYTTGFEDLKNIAIARLMLDNFEHIKAYWVMLTEKLAQIALWFGADDLDGTIIEEQIGHTAGAKSAKGLTIEKIEDLILEADCKPIERDSFYNQININNLEIEAFKKLENIEDIKEKILNNTRIAYYEALKLYENINLLDIGKLANFRKNIFHKQNKKGESLVSFVVDRNINYTNICVSECLFCAFFKPLNFKNQDGYVISKEILAEKIKETLELGGTQILLQGGMNPNLDLNWYLDLLSWIKNHFKIHIHGFSPPEIVFIANKSGLSIQDTIEKLRLSGLDTIPGGGAEILSDEIRQKISPNKCNSSEWLEVMRQAHKLGMKTTATMMFGHIEKTEHIIEHLIKIRELQDKTGGFTAFIPWTFQPINTRLNLKPAGAYRYLKILALSRIILDNIANIQASWVTQGDKIAQLALFFGANDFGSTMIEENVVAAAGVKFRLSKQDIIRLIENAGFKAVQRDCFYNFLD